MEASVGLPEWRKRIVDGAKSAMSVNDLEPISVACRVEATFFLPKPKSSKNDFPIVMPDVDKLARGLLDGLVYGGVILDDKFVTDLVALKRYGELPGVLVEIDLIS